MKKNGPDASFSPIRFFLFALVFLAGTAALSWETLWQLRASLAMGVSSYGTAITLAVTMGGMSAGAMLAGWFLRRRSLAHPLRVYALFELSIGAAGVLLGPMFDAVAALDSAAFHVSPSLAPAVHVLGIVFALGLPTLAMGATLPLFGLIAAQLKTSLSLLYGLNTLGAAAGTLLVALLGIPYLGVGGSGWVVSGVNLVVCLSALLLSTRLAKMAPGQTIPAQTPRGDEQPIATPISTWTWAVVFVTGFSTFALEIAWFRSLRAAFLSTTDSFAVMLAAVLLALGVAARLAPAARLRLSSPAPLLALAGTCMLLVTPLIERFDTLPPWTVRPVLLGRFAMTFVAVAPAMLLLGIVLPWLLDAQHHPKNWAKLYSVNTFGAIVGALGAAWLLLPTLGFARSSWAIAALVIATAVLKMQGNQRMGFAAIGAIALVIAVGFETGVGRTRIQGQLPSQDFTILAHDEGPDATVSVVEFADKRRSLIIDGFQAASELRLNHYMEWMGRLPMILHSDPQDALVICFGTGQTANAVRNEGIQRLTIVDLNRAVFAMAPYFSTNQGVLKDPRVEALVMDGRAFLRRTERLFDVITLEPMPPNFAGVNALYSKEFYQTAKAHLKDGGIVAQWVPFHLITPITSASIIASLEEVFPGSFLWLDPVTPTGILIGKKGGPALPPDAAWPGFSRAVLGRDLSPEQIVYGALLSGRKLKDFASHGVVITDDNQFLAYGPEAMALWRYGLDMLPVNMRNLSEYTGRKLPTKR